MFRHMLEVMLDLGIERCLLITIGEYNGTKGCNYAPIRQAQLELANEVLQVTLVNDDFHTMRSKGLMKDDFHYFQQAYNEVGVAAGSTAGLIANTLPRDGR